MDYKRFQITSGHKEGKQLLFMKIRLKGWNSFISGVKPFSGVLGL